MSPNWLLLVPPGGRVNGSTSPTSPITYIFIIQAVVQKRFEFPENSVELYAEKVATRGLCAIAQAESLRYKLIGGLAVRRYILSIINGSSYFYDNVSSTFISLNKGGFLGYRISLWRRSPNFGKSANIDLDSSYSLIIFGLLALSVAQLKLYLFLGLAMVYYDSSWKVELKDVKS